jgi:hypothetical protein
LIVLSTFKVDESQKKMNGSIISMNIQELKVSKKKTKTKQKQIFQIKNALAGNRTRAARVAGEHSTTEPPVQLSLKMKLFLPKKFVFKISHSIMLNL